MRPWIIAIGLLLVTAGCIGTSGEQAPADASEDAADDGAASGSDTDAGDGGHTHEAQPERHWENRSGEVEGTNAVVATEGVTNETVEIPDTVQQMRVRLAAESGEITGDLYPPGCQPPEDPTEAPPSCSHDLDTYNGTEETFTPDGGVATWETDEGTGGNWTLEMRKADPGQSPVPYELSFFYVDVHKPGPGHHDA